MMNMVCTGSSEFAVLAVSDHGQLWPRDPKGFSAEPHAWTLRLARDWGERGLRQSVCG